jgi:hypothetical protein
VRAQKVAEVHDTALTFLAPVASTLAGDHEVPFQVSPKPSFTARQKLAELHDTALPLVPIMTVGPVFGGPAIAAFGAAADAPPNSRTAARMPNAQRR